MILIWLHGAELAQMSLAKELYKSLVATGNGKAACILRHISLLINTHRNLNHKDDLS